MVLEEEQQEWDMPTSLDDAQKRLTTLRRQVGDIETQLGDKKRRLRAHASAAEWEKYLEWRQRTKWARVHKLDELRRTKDWIRSHQYDGLDLEPTG